MPPAPRTRFDRWSDWIVEKPGVLAALTLLFVAVSPLWVAGRWILRSRDERRGQAALRRATSGLRRDGERLVGAEGALDWSTVREARWYHVDIGLAFAQDEEEIVLDLTFRDGARRAYRVVGALDDSWPGMPVREAGRTSGGLPEAVAGLAAVAWVVVIAVVLDG
jgi:hypothetical protein